MCGWKIFRLFIIPAFILCSCSSYPYRYPLIGTPAVFWETGLDPFVETGDDDRDANIEVYYATDRRPAGKDDKEPFYTKDRGHILRLGKATVQIGDDNMNWPEIQSQSLSKDRKAKLWMQVTGIHEFGGLWSTLAWETADYDSATAREPSSRFSEEINKKLSRSKQKDIFIFVHGYKMVFEYPVLVACEFWHYLGYDGVFLAYSWPSIPKYFAYMADVETAAYSARNFRQLLTYLATDTNVRHIHIMCFSTGTRIVSKALTELRLINYGKDEAFLHRKFKIGQLLITGPDIDPGIFKAYHADGLNDVPELTTIYISEKDKSLKLLERIFGQSRLGSVGGMSQSDTDYLVQSADVSLVDVSEAESVETDRGHDYFRRSPWVSSDVLITLKFNTEPSKRGLIRSEDSRIWKFPSDYVKTLNEAFERHRSLDSVHP